MMNNEKLTFKQKMKNDYGKLKNDWNDPTKKKVRTKKTMIFTGSVIRTLLLIGLVFIILLPIFQKLSFAFRHPNTIADPQVVWIPSEFSILNIQIALKLLDFSITVWNTIIVSLVAMIIQVVSAALVGYAFARLKFKGSELLFYITLFTLVIPNETLHVARTLFFTNTGFFGIKLIGNVFAVFIMSAFGQGIRSAIFIYLFRQFFRGLPPELEESAQVDGAGVLRTFWSVMLPNARGAIVTVSLFSFVWQWNDYYFASLFSYSEGGFSVLSTRLAGGTERLSTIISGWSTSGLEFFKELTDESIRQNTLFHGLISNTAALLMMLPVLIGYLFFQKLFVESIERTGIVG